MALLWPYLISMLPLFQYFLHSIFIIFNTIAASMKRKRSKCKSQTKKSSDNSGTVAKNAKTSATKPVGRSRDSRLRFSQLNLVPETTLSLSVNSGVGSSIPRRSSRSKTRSQFSKPQQFQQSLDSTLCISEQEPRLGPPSSNLRRCVTSKLKNEVSDALLNSPAPEPTLCRSLSSPGYVRAARPVVLKRQRRQQRALQVADSEKEKDGGDQGGSGNHAEASKEFSSADKTTSLATATKSFQMASCNNSVVENESKVELATSEVSLSAVGLRPDQRSTFRSRASKSYLVADPINFGLAASEVQHSTVASEPYERHDKGHLSASKSYLPADQTNSELATPQKQKSALPKTEGSLSHENPNSPTVAEASAWKCGGPAVSSMRISNTKPVASNVEENTEDASDLKSLSRHFTPEVPLRAVGSVSDQKQTFIASVSESPLKADQTNLEFATPQKQESTLPKTEGSLSHEKPSSPTVAEASAWKCDSGGPAVSSMRISNAKPVASNAKENTDDAPDLKSVSRHLTPEVLLKTVGSESDQKQTFIASVSESPLMKDQINLDLETPQKQESTLPKTEGSLLHEKPNSPTVAEASAWKCDSGGPVVSSMRISYKKPVASNVEENTEDASDLKSLSRHFTPEVPLKTVGSVSDHKQTFNASFSEFPLKADQTNLEFAAPQKQGSARLTAVESMRYEKPTSPVVSACPAQQNDSDSGPVVSSLRISFRKPIGSSSVSTKDSAIRHELLPSAHRRCSRSLKLSASNATIGSFVTELEFTDKNEQTRARCLPSIRRSASAIGSDSSAYKTVSEATVRDEAIRQQLIKSIRAPSASKSPSIFFRSKAAIEASSVFVTEAEYTETDSELRQQLLPSLRPSRMYNTRTKPVASNAEENTEDASDLKSVSRHFTPEVPLRTVGSVSDQKATFNSTFSEFRLEKPTKSSAAATHALFKSTPCTAASNSFDGRSLGGIARSSSNMYVTVGAETVTDSAVRRQYLESLHPSNIYLTMSQTTVNDSAIRRELLPSAHRRWSRSLKRSASNATIGSFVTELEFTDNNEQTRARCLPSIRRSASAIGSDSSAYDTVSEATVRDEAIRQQLIKSVRVPRASTKSPSIFFRSKAAIEASSVFVTEAECTETDSELRQQLVPSLRPSRMYTTVESEVTVNDSSLRRRHIPSVSAIQSFDASNQTGSGGTFATECEFTDDNTATRARCLPSVIAGSDTKAYETVSQATVSDNEVRRQLVRSIRPPANFDSSLVTEAQPTESDRASRRQRLDIKSEATLSHDEVMLRCVEEPASAAKAATADQQAESLEERDVTATLAASRTKQGRRRRASAESLAADSTYFYDPHGFLSRSAKSRRVSVAPHLLPLSSFSFFCDERGQEFDLSVLQRLTLQTKDVDEQRLAIEAAVAKSSRWSRRIRNNPPMRLKPTSNVRVFGYIRHPVRCMDRVLIGFLEPDEHAKLRQLLDEQTTQS